MIYCINIGLVNSIWQKIASLTRNFVAKIQWEKEK